MSKPLISCHFVAKREARYTLKREETESMAAPRYLSQQGESGENPGFSLKVMLKLQEGGEWRWDLKYAQFFSQDLPLATTLRYKEGERVIFRQCEEGMCTIEQIMEESVRLVFPENTPFNAIPASVDIIFSEPICQVGSTG